nr:unnamed protein product [Callosobruchus chinensis]
MSKNDEVVASILESFSTLKLFIKEIDKLETRLTKCKKNKKENEDLVIQDIVNVIDKIHEHSTKIKHELDTHPATQNKRKKKTGDALTEEASSRKCKKDKRNDENKKDEVNNIDGKEVDKENNDDINTSKKSSTGKATTKGKKTKTNDEPNIEKKNQSDDEGSEKSEHLDEQDKVKNGEKANRNNLQNHKDDEKSDNETCTNSNEDKEDTDDEEENDRTSKTNSDPLRNSNSPVFDNDTSDNQKADESTKENKESDDVKPQIRLVDLSKLIDAKPKKSVKFDSSLIIISSDEEHSPKKQSTDKNGKLKSALKNSPLKVAQLECDISAKIKDEIKNTKKRGHQEDDDLVISGSDSDIKVVSNEEDSGRRRSSRVQRNNSKVMKRQEDLKKIFKRKGNKNGNSSFEIVNDRSKKNKKSKDLLMKLSSGSSSADSDSDEDVEEKTPRKNRRKGKQCSAPAPDDKFSRKLYVSLPLVECDKLKEVYLRNKEILEIKRLTSLTSLKKKRRSSVTESQDTDSNEECGRPTSKKSKIATSKSIIIDKEVLKITNIQSKCCVKIYLLFKKL